jgi:hypothetical protein
MVLSYWRCLQYHEIAAAEALQCFSCLCATANRLVDAGYGNPSLNAPSINRAVCDSKSVRSMALNSDFVNIPQGMRNHIVRFEYYRRSIRTNVLLLGHGAAAHRKQGQKSIVRIATLQIHGFREIVKADIGWNQRGRLNFVVIEAQARRKAS